MVEVVRYDLIVLGGGKRGGKPLLWSAQKVVKKVAMIERKMVGGSCINVACIPTKTLVASAKVAHTAQKMASYGILTDKIQVDFQKVMERKNKIVEGMIQANYKSFIDSGVEMIMGHGRFINEKLIEVELTETPF